MPTVELNATSLNYTEVGQGPTLLLVHGFPLDHTMWRGQIDGLADCCRVIAPDLRGFGASGAAGETTTMEQFADDLADLLAALNVTEPITFCGLSMGGYVAWQFWQRHAERLGRLILCDTRAVADDADAARGRLETAQQVLDEGTSVVADAMLPKLFAEQTVREQPALVNTMRGVMLSTSPASIAAALRGMAARADVTETLPQIDVPSLIVCGEHDAISRVGEMRSIAEALPNAQFVEVPGAGHMAPLERPDQVNAAIRSFLEVGG